MIFIFMSPPRHSFHSEHQYNKHIMSFEGNIFQFFALDYIAGEPHKE